MPGSLHSSGPVYRKLRMLLVVRLASAKLLSIKCLTVGFLRVSCSETGRTIEMSTV